MNFPLYFLSLSPDKEWTSYYRPGVETGALIYPWPVHKKSVRPYIGASWVNIEYQQEVRPDVMGPALNLNRINLMAGLSWCNKVGLWEIGASYLTNPGLQYPLSRTDFSTVNIPQWSFKLSYKYVFDATLGLASYATGDGIVPQRLEEFKVSGKLNSFSLAVGLSTAFTLSPSSYNQELRPYLDDPVEASLFPDISIGYYHYNTDAAIQLSYRSIKQSQKSFSINQKFLRQSIALELLKFLGDYQGFVPFLGLFVSLEYLNASESDESHQSLNLNDTRASWGIVFGWDIRPLRAPGIILRTNLRYTPFLSLTTSKDREIMFNQLEVNFIQVVVYPERIF